MTAADKIEAARALIEPLTGHTPGPWQVDAPEDESVEIAARIFAIAGLYETAPEALPDARLIAAAPALRDTVAALADLADAQAQENARLREAVKAADALFEQASSVHLGGHLPMAKIHSTARGLGPLLTVYQRARAALGDAS